MRTKGRRTAIVITGFGLGVLLLTGYLLREDIRWWRRMRGVVQVRIEDDGRAGGTASLSLTAPMEVRHATALTHSWIATLPNAGNSHEWELTKSMLAVSTIVVFLPVTDTDAWIKDSSFSLWFFDSEDDKGFIACKDGVFDCTKSAWHEFMRELIRPAIPELVQKFRNQQEDPVKRREAALTLAWVEPRTEGLIDYLITNKEFFGLGYMGPVAEPAVPKIIDLLGSQRDEIEILHLVTSLGKIGPKAIDAIQTLEKLEQDEDRFDRVRKAATEALRKIRGTSR